MAQRLNGMHVTHYFFFYYAKYTESVQQTVARREAGTIEAQKSQRVAAVLCLKELFTLQRQSLYERFTNVR